MGEIEERERPRLLRRPEWKEQNLGSRTNNIGLLYNRPVSCLDGWLASYLLIVSYLVSQLDKFVN